MLSRAVWPQQHGTSTEEIFFSPGNALGNGASKGSSFFSPNNKGLSKQSQVEHMQESNRERDLSLPKIEKKTLLGCSQ